MNASTTQIAMRWLFALFGLAILIVAGISSRLTPPAALARSAAPSASTEMPANPTDGLLTLVIPRGAAAAQQAGGRGYVLPAVISLRVGDRIIIRNDDSAAHMFLYAWVRPGQTVERTFTQTGSEVYSSGCGLHAAAILNFTSIFVSA